MDYVKYTDAVLQEVLLMNNREIGSKAEDRAVRYLMLRLYKIVERNYAARTGEIDIIAKKDNTYVFVEVKYRSDISKGYPAEAVTELKKKKIRRTAEHYLVSKHINIDNTDIRFDVIEILGRKIKHIKAAF